MGSYQYLGRRGPILGDTDTTGLNPGNWTIAFTPAILNFTLPEVLIYKIQCAGALGATFNVFVDSDQWDSNVFGTQNSWHDDGGDELVVRTGQTLYLLYSNPTSDNTPPMATCFLRYDISLASLAGLHV